MTVRVKGDFDILAKWERALKTAPESLQDMTPQMAEETIDLIKEGFRRQSDPYGTPWKPKKRSDGRAILVGKTARLRNGWHRVNGRKRRGFIVAPSVTYAAPHQDGDGKRNPPRPPRRMMIPTRSRGLPPAWARAYKDTAVEVFSQHFTSSKSAGGIGFVQGKLIGLKRRFNAMALARKAMRALSANE